MASRAARAALRGREESAPRAPGGVGEPAVSVGIGRRRAAQGLPREGRQIVFSTSVIPH
jgi:hypothetical protein